MLCSCGGYINSYSAFLLITSSHGDEASMKFDTFKGSYNFKLKRDGNAEHTLDLNASLGEGEINIYIGVGGEEELLLTVKGGEGRIFRVRYMLRLSWEYLQFVWNYYSAEFEENLFLVDRIRIEAIKLIAQKPLTLL